MKYKPMPFPRLGSAGPCKFRGVVVINGYPHAIWEDPDFDDRNNRIDAIHLIEFEAIEVEEIKRIEFEDVELKP